MRCFVVGFVILIVQLNLSLNKGFSRLYRVTGVRLDDIGNLGLVGWIWKVGDGVHAGVDQVISDEVLEGDEVVRRLK